MNKIGWCDSTFNPVWGCRNHCKYCYARKMAKRFWKDMYRFEFLDYCKKHPNWAWTGDHLWGLSDFIPTFLYSQFNKKFPFKPQRIFVGSMSEIYHWEREWMSGVLDKIKEYPQHTFQFLTKHPEVYRRYIFPGNCWLGITVTNNKEACSANFEVAPENAGLIKYVSIEPVLERIEPESLYHLKANWIIMGAETGNRKGKTNIREWIFDWVYDMVTDCKMSGIPLYIKDSIGKLYPGYPDTGEAKEFPKGR